MNKDGVTANFFLVGELKNLSVIKRLRVDEAGTFCLRSGSFILVGKIGKVGIAVGGFDINNGVSGDSAAFDFFGIDLG